MKDALALLEWLVLARKPLRWHEIQVLKSMDLDRQSIDFHRQGFLVNDPRDICGSFVEVQDDGSVELIHLTARLYDLVCLSKALLTVILIADFWSMKALSIH